MPCYKITLAYDGTNYSGWQIQPNAPSVQQHIQDALATLLKEQIIVIGSGRTDAGVHAINQVAHFKVDRELEFNRLHRSLNGILPVDIRIKHFELAPEHFHAQRNAISKEYHYYIHLDQVMDPFVRLYRWHLFRKIDLALLKEGAALFVGTHDFTSFANERYAGSVAKNPVRTIYRLDVCLVGGGGVRLEFEGNGFLYKMVRNIVGTLVNVASGRISMQDVRAIFEAKDRRKAAAAAPPQGLFLADVRYI